MSRGVASRGAVLQCLLLALVALLGIGCGPRRAAAPAAPFSDATQEAGLAAFRHVNGAAGRFYYPETFGSGVALFDYDRDGWLDILLVNGDSWPGEKAAGERPTLALYRNQGKGVFADVTAAAGLKISLYGMGAAVGDYDNDGFDDLYITGLGRSLLLHNEGGKGFREIGRDAGVDNAGHWGASAAWLDYDLDGDLDLFVCNHVRWRPDAEQTCRQGGIRVYCGPLVYTADRCRLFQNEGKGRFADVTRRAGIEKATGGKALGVAVWDLDGDRYPEILVANDLSANYLFHNRGDGTFEEQGTLVGFAYAADGIARSGMGIDVADTRNDGGAQVLVSNFSREPNSFFDRERDGPLLFQERTYEVGMGEPSLLRLGFGLVFFDFDNDGGKDAFVTNGHIQPEIARFEPSLTFAQRPLLFRNRGDGAFEEVSAAMGPAFRAALVGRGAACGDIDNDGDLDLVHTGNGGPAQLLRNEWGNRNRSLQIRLEGTRSNRDGIGAQVRVRVGNRWLRDQVRSGSSYLSASDLRLHFGLGKAVRADEVEVRWPDGAVERRAGVPAGALVWREGERN